MDFFLQRLLCVVPLAIASMSAFAQADAQPSPVNEVQVDNSPFSERSPWLLAPVFSANPKLGASLGVMGGYIHYFDEKSRPSIFALSGQYTSTESIIAGAFAKTSFGEDHHRVIAGLAYGNIKNDYDDYLGTGVPLKNNAELRTGIARYTYRITGNWFVGAQGIYQNFNIVGETAFDDQILSFVGVQPFKSAGAGLVAQNDSRDDENMPTKGWFINLNNIAFRESLGSDNNYDVYRVELRHYIPHGDRNVFALRLMNHLTNDAEAAARAPVQLRGYKIGQYSGKYMSSIEGEERYRLGEKWTATLFAGVACLYGEGKGCTDSGNQFPAGGVGVQYILKPKEGIVLNLEYAAGKSGNYGVYLKIGYAY